jgi:two-component system phosphate regulon sensor histidine kinase PhoR
MTPHSTRSQTAPGEAAELDEARRLLELERRRYRELFDLAPVGYLVTDLDGAVLEANAAACALLGRDETALVGRMLHELVAADRRQALDTVVAEAAGGGRGQDEVPFSMPTGGSIVLQLQAARGEGAIHVALADVSPNLRRERAEREFVANAAHQLRTPVAAIASSIEVLQGGAKEVPEERDRFLAHLDRQCNRLVQLTRALLLLARAQALDEPPALELVPLRPLLDGIAAAQRPAPGVEVRVSCPADLAALTSRDLLEQALGNLAENAAKFTAEGEIVLTAAALDDGAISLDVSDSGPGAQVPSGMSFERFYRDPGAQGEGFGLGLAIASEALRVLGGSLVVDGTGRGTRALVTLPAAGTLKQ